MAEDDKSGTDAAETTSTSRARAREPAALVYQYVLGAVTLALLVLRSEPERLATDGPLLLLFLLIGVVCQELEFAISPDVVADLGGLFDGAAVLTLGFNGVWVPVFSKLYALLKRERPNWEGVPLVPRLANHLLNLSLSILAPWLGLFVYHVLLEGAIPLANLEANLAPALAFVLVHWIALPVSLFPLLIIARGGLGGAAGWIKDILTGFALGVYAPILFSLAVAVILNRLGLGFFLFVSAGLLGVSLMAQRLARSLAAERERVQELTVLNALNADIIHNPPDTTATGELFVRHAPGFAPGANFALCLFDTQQLERCQVMVEWRDGAAHSATDGPLTPLWAWLRDQHQLLHVADVSQGVLPFAWDPQQDGPQPGSLLLLPLLAADPANPEAERCIGGLLLSHRRRRAFEKALPSVTALANQLAAALENARLYQAALARERLERELVLARGIQTSFLPADVPHVPGWAFAASLEPARHVSGDFYDFIPLPGDRWGLLIADVADKGMPAALYMALVRTLIRAHAPEHADDPAACLLDVNDHILADTPQADLFVTVFYGILDPATGELIFTNAGHNPPYLCRCDGDGPSPTPMPLRTVGTVLGILPGIQLHNARAHFDPGDYLVLYTDGVTEAHDQALKEFGEQRLLAEITRQDGASVRAILRRIRAAVQAFVGDAPQSDDLTLMVVGRAAAGGDSISQGGSYGRDPDFHHV